MKKILIICLIAISAVYAVDKTYGKAKITEVRSIYDGDTFRCTIKSYPKIIGDDISVRVAGIDCPEMTDKRPEIKALAQQAKQYTVARLREGKIVWLMNMRRDKYFRILADISIDGKDLAKELIEKGLAKPYDGGTKEAW
jgi:micrococcal nuclease